MINTLQWLVDATAAAIIKYRPRLWEENKTGNGGSW